MEKNNQYVAPEVYVVECQVEKGYASSGGAAATFSIGGDVESGSTRSTDWWFD